MQNVVKHYFFHKMNTVVKQECQTDTKYAIFVATFLGAGYIRLWEQIPFIQFLDNSRAIIQAWGIWLVIELGQDIMPTNIFTKFDHDRAKTLWLRERKP